jgi:hypothetical protein
MNGGETMKSCVISAHAPAFGLRVCDDGDTVTVYLNDDGGHGRPCAVLLIAVKEEHSKLHVLIGANEVRVPPGVTAEELRGAAELVMLDETKDPPYVACSTRLGWQQKHDGQWPWPFERPLVLALLLFPQSPDVGAQIEALCDPRACAEGTPGYWSHVADAVNLRLAEESVGELRGGLIRGPDPAVKKEEEAASAAKSQLVFSLASCQYQSDFLDYMPDNATVRADNATVRGPADASLLALGDLLHEPGGPSLLLFVGDQVYVDATAGLFDPKAKDDRYRLPYERQGGSQGSKRALQSRGIEIHMMLDDHEIVDNWEPGGPAPQPGKRPDIELGREAYWKYQRQALPPANGQIWYTFTHGNLPFFLADARTEREGRTALNFRDARIMRSVMNGDQFPTLCAWMTVPGHEELPKFVTTASAFFPRSLAVARNPDCALHSDAWDGYPTSMHELLAHACDNEMKGLVFLSGDEHISNWARATVTKLDPETKTPIGKPCVLHSVHSSALYAPYPFANAVPEDFARSETFEFSVEDVAPGTLKHYRCNVHAEFAPEGDGFALLKVARNEKGWQMEVDFHDANGRKDHPEVVLQVL